MAYIYTLVTANKYLLNNAIFIIVTNCLANRSMNTFYILIKPLSLNKRGLLYHKDTLL